MPLLQWNDTFSVSVREFDDQHKKLIALINKLYDAMKEGKGKTVLGEILNELIEYTVVHFNAEEQLMSRYGYPEFSLHAEEHKKLTEKVKEYQTLFEQGKLFITIEVLQFLKDWLSGHILNTDKKYGPFFNEKGLNK